MSAAGSGGLELTGLSKSDGQRVALDGLSFTVAPAQMFGFVGPNGAGKTTTMRTATSSTPARSPSPARSC